MGELVWLDNKNPIKANEVFTDSLIVAKEFEKEHSNVLRDIRSLIENLEAVENKDLIGQFKFEESSYVNSQNKKQPKYALNEELTMLLIMGYTTTKALEIKSRFIKEFKQMKKELKDLKQARKEGITCRHSLTDSIQKYEVLMQSRKPIAKQLC